MPADNLLDVAGLSVCFGHGAARKQVVSDVSFALRRGETLALVGESGSGKTLTGKTLLRILPKGASITGGEAIFHDDGEDLDLFAINARRMRQLRGGRISMIFQEPMSSLSPLHTIGSQVAEALRLHEPMAMEQARLRCLETFEHVGFPDPARAWTSYPFELSGGLRQRAMIAMAIVCRPALMIADEPTTALDVTTQAMVLDLIRQVQADNGMSVIMITHDLGVVANMADSVAVLRKGRVVESGPADAVLTAPGHGYTRSLIAAAPEIPLQVAPCDAADIDAPVLAAENVQKTYALRGGLLSGPSRFIRAVADLNLSVRRNETVGLVGESGSGKSTLSRLLLGAERPDPGGIVRFCGKGEAVCDVATLRGSALKAFRRKVQVVFQDPFSSLSPRMTVREILTEPFKIHGIGDRASRIDRAVELMKRVGLSPDHLGRFPHAFSGGQRQRICIARALALEPEMVLCDEPTSALDVSVQSAVLDLLEEVKADLDLSYLFISHDLAVVARLSDRVAVMRRGRIVEEGPADQLFNDPRHPYTRALIAASPEPDRNRPLDLAEVAQGAGEPETWADPFRYVDDDAPSLIEVAPQHFVRCAA